MTKRKGYGKYDESQRAEIGKQAKKNGIRPTAKMFNISKSTVNSILVEYNKALNEVSKSSSEKASTLESLPKRKRGGTTLLPKDIDAKVIQMIKSLREAGNK